MRKKVHRLGDHFIKRNNKFSLTKEQKDIIFGTLLGDGYLNARGNHVRLQLNHGPQQELYIKWKAEKLHNLLTPRGLRFEEHNDKHRPSGKLTRWNFYTTSHEYLQFLHSILYINNGKKYITKEVLLERLNPLALYVWLADDGSLDKRKSKPTKDGKVFINSLRFKICTCSEDGEFEKMLCEVFKEKFNIDAKVSRHKSDKSNYRNVYIVNFNTENTLKLIDIVKPYVGGGMEYKFDISCLGTEIIS